MLAYDTRAPVPAPRRREGLGGPPPPPSAETPAATIAAAAPIVLWGSSLSACAPGASGPGSGGMLTPPPCPCNRRRCRTVMGLRIPLWSAAAASRERWVTSIPWCHGHQHRWVLRPLERHLAGWLAGTNLFQTVPARSWPALLPCALMTVHSSRWPVVPRQGQGRRRAVCPGLQLRRLLQYQPPPANCHVQRRGWQYGQRGGYGYGCGLVRQGGGCSGDGGGVQGPCHVQR